MRVLDFQGTLYRLLSRVLTRRIHNTKKAHTQNSHRTHTEHIQNTHSAQTETEHTQRKHTETEDTHSTHTAQTQNTHSTHTAPVASALAQSLDVRELLRRRAYDDKHVVVILHLRYFYLAEPAASSRQ